MTSGSSALSLLAKKQGEGFNQAERRGGDLGRVNRGLDGLEGVDGSRIGEKNSGVQVCVLSAATSHQSIHLQDEGEGSGWQARYTFGLLGFLGMTVIYMIRVNLSIAIVAMVGKANTTYVSSNTCPAPNSTEDGVNLEGDFDWDEQTQGLVLSAFFYGYVASNFLGGRATEYLGGRLMFGVGVVGPSLITLLSPFCASVSKELFIIIRVVEGLVQGVTFPSMHFMMSAWIPPKDKAIFGSIILAGMQAGTVLANGVGGLLCNSEFLGGWPSAFYVPGAVGVAWGIPWFLLIHDQPEHHPRISKKELSYILTHRRFVNKEKAVAIPWRSLVTSLPLWSILIMNLGYSFEFYMLLTELPTYFSNMMHFEMSNNGLMSALPYMLQGVLSVVWGFAMSALTARDKVTVNFVRKFSTAFAMYISAGALITMLWVDCNRGLALVVMCLAVGANGAINSGSCLSEQDIAPNLVGTLKGITNSVGAATGILAPLITGAIINNNQTLSAWRIVFIMTSVINIISCTIFIIWATDKVQPWNEPKNKALQIQTEFERRVK